MTYLNESDFVKSTIAFRNRMNKTNCSLEDIMRIYTGKPIVDYFCSESKSGGFVPHRRHRLRKAPTW